MFFHCKLDTPQCADFLSQFEFSFIIYFSFGGPAESTPKNLFLDYMYATAIVSETNCILSSETGYDFRAVIEL